VAFEVLVHPTAQRVDACAQRVDPSTDVRTLRVDPSAEVGTLRVDAAAEVAALRVDADDQGVDAVTQVEEAAKQGSS
jgi:hypothetical protein